LLFDELFFFPPVAGEGKRRVVVVQWRERERETGERERDGGVVIECDGGSEERPKKGAEQGTR
jgi:hypothetical protein